MCFAGGFTLGTVQAGFELAGKCELKGAFGAPNCEANRHLLGYDWKLQEGDHVWEHPGGDVHYIAGNPPCSGFSLMSNRNFRGVDSPVNKCMWAFVNYVAHVKPLTAVFESVQQAYTGGRPLMQALAQWLRDSTGLDYHLWHVKHNNLALGGCAERRRYFFVVSRIPFGVERPEIRRTPTLWDAIGDLESSPITWERQPYRTGPSRWAERLRDERGGFDGHVTRLTPEFHRAMALLPEAGPWGPGECISDVAKRYYERTGTLPESWEYRKEKLLNNNFHLGFHQLVRWKKDNHARVITGGALQLVLHPTLDRTITHREAARIMGFPDTWVIKPMKGYSQLQATWGKGIPVGSGRWISTWVRHSIYGNPGEITGEPIGDREYLVDLTKVQLTT
jgi:site-specific DNA-cytosine methylase